MKMIIYCAFLVLAPVMLFAQGEYLVNTYQDTSQRDPRIVRDDAGSYTIVWCSVNQADADSDSDADREID